MKWTHRYPRWMRVPIAGTAMFFASAIALSDLVAEETDVPAQNLYTVPTDSANPPNNAPPTRESLDRLDGGLRFEEGELVSFVPEASQRDISFSELQGFASEEYRPGSTETPLGELNSDYSETQDGREGKNNAAPSAAVALAESNDIQTVNIQKRSSISFDPRVRGYRLGQLLTHGDGVYWMPVRPDLDSILSKLDPQLITSTQVIPGPYTARLGPGFSFIESNLMTTPRYEDCPQSHNQIGYDYRPNGGRQYFHDTLMGGNESYGYILNYGFRNGSDYRSGNGTLIPGSYNVNNVSAQLGFHVSEYGRLETRYDFMDQNDTQFPGQIFRVDRLQSNNFAFSLHDYDDPVSNVRLKLDGWHNRTPMRGSVDDGGEFFRIRERIQLALNNFFGANDVAFTGTTAGVIANSGGRLESLVGEPEFGQLRLGGDLRFIKQNIEEDFGITGTPAILGQLPLFVNTRMPQSEMMNPGVYSEAILPVTEFWNARVGGRVDFVHTTANGLLPVSNLEPDELKQSNTLYAFYMMNDLQINECWTANVGFGQAQRPPTLLERYADGVFVSVLQSGFTRVIGDPNLNQERLWQVDGTVSADFDYARMSFSAFQAWIQDYITLQGVAADPTGANLVKYFSTPLATLSGFEFRGDVDISEDLNTYLTAHYVQGQDQTIAAPLPGISPFESRLGLLWHSPENDEWGLDTNVRVVSSQNRLGVIRRVTGQQTVETFTPYFATVNIRGYWNPSPNVSFVGGVENLLDRNYLEHLDLRLPGSPPFAPAFAYAQGITPYVGFNVQY
jgi:iron complex outermembrane recepter protein